MKIRQSFVTNSSSSSYIVVYEIQKPNDFYDFVKEEFGRRGLADFKGSITTKDMFEDATYEPPPEELEDNKQYIYGWVVTYSNEGDTSSSVLDIIHALPEGTCKLVYEGGDY